VLKDRPFDPEYANPGDLVATAVEDAHRLEDAAARWAVHDSPSEDNSEETDAAVGDLVKRLRELDYVHAWAVIVAVQWFWEHDDEGIDIEQHRWWTLMFRRQGKEERLANTELAETIRRAKGEASKQGSGGAEGQHPGPDRHKRNGREASKEENGAEGGKET
jgi:hypothetical protein